MTDRGHLEKNYLVGLIFLLRFIYCGSLSKFESCNGDAFNVFLLKQSHLVSILFFIHLNLLMEFPVSNDEKYFHFVKIHIF